MKMIGGDLDDAIINLTEIADRHRDIIANPVPYTIETK